MYPSETAAAEIYDEVNAGDQCDASEIPKDARSDITNIDSVLQVDYSGDKLASYTPSSLMNLQGTLERERKKFSAASSDHTGKQNWDEESDALIDNGSGLRGEGDHFTESTHSTASAILF